MPTNPTQTALVTLAPNNTHDPDLTVENDNSASQTPLLTALQTFYTNTATCPITGQIMSDPFLTTDGYCYDKSALDTYLTEHENHTPKNVLIEAEQLTIRTRRNLTLKTQIEEMKNKKNKTLKDYLLFYQNVADESVFAMCPIEDPVLDGPYDGGHIHSYRALVQTAQSGYTETGTFQRGTSHSSTLPVILYLQLQTNICSLRDSLTEENIAAPALGELEKTLLSETLTYRPDPFNQNTVLLTDKPTPEYNEHTPLLTGGTTNTEGLFPRPLVPHETLTPAKLALQLLSPAIAFTLVFYAGAILLLCIPMHARAILRSESVNNPKETLIVSLGMAAGTYTFLYMNNIRDRWAKPFTETPLGSGMNVDYVAFSFATLIAYGFFLFGCYIMMERRVPGRGIPTEMQAGNPGTQNPLLVQQQHGAQVETHNNAVNTQNNNAARIAGGRANALRWMNTSS